MALFYFDLIGVDHDDIGTEYDSFGEARNAAIVSLGEYLRDNPGYARQAHWQVDVYDDTRTLLFNIVIATVDKRRTGELDLI